MAVSEVCYENTSVLAVATSTSTTETGLICILDLRKSKVTKAIEVPYKVRYANSAFFGVSFLTFSVEFPRYWLFRCKGFDKILLERSYFTNFFTFFKPKDNITERHCTRLKTAHPKFTFLLAMKEKL